VAVSDAGGGPAPWTVSVAPQVSEDGVTVTAEPTVAAPGALSVSMAVAAGAAEHDLTGFVLLTRDGEVRRIPYWFRVESPKLGTERATAISRPGLYRGNTNRGVPLVSSYR